VDVVVRAFARGNVLRHHNNTHNLPPFIADWHFVRLNPKCLTLPVSNCFDYSQLWLSRTNHLLVIDKIFRRIVRINVTHGFSFQVLDRFSNVLRRPLVYP
jgi:hypothetical protein